MSKHHRLYIFTGKGGVGKTTLAKSFTHYLRSQNIKAVYLTFATTALGNEGASNSFHESDGLHQLDLDLELSAQGYIEKKLGSKMVASWIIKTPFFRALINMIPGFNYLIYLGQTLELAEADKDLVFVLDSAASGHALTMVESTSNFGQIFGKGLVFEDTKKMLSRINNPDFTKAIICSLPTQMSWQEAMELKSGLAQRSTMSCDIVVNNSLLSIFNDRSNIPQNLEQKLLFEDRLIQENSALIKALIPHSLQKSQKEIERDLLGSLESLL